MNQIMGFLFGVGAAYAWYKGFPEDAQILMLIAISGFILHISDQIKDR